MKTKIKFNIKWDNPSTCIFEKVKKVRELLNDYAEVNIILNHQKQVADKRIARAIQLTLQEFNEMPPIRTHFSACNIPNEMMLLNGAIAKILRSLTITDIRNFYPVQTGDVTINPDKSQQWYNLATAYEQDYRIMAEKIKKSINVSRGFGQWWSW